MGRGRNPALGVKSSQFREAIHIDLNVSYRTIFLIIIGLQVTVFLAIITGITYLYHTPGSIYYNAHFMTEHKTLPRKRFAVAAANNSGSGRSIQRQSSINRIGSRMNYSTAWVERYVSHISNDDKNNTANTVISGTHNPFVMLTTTSKAFINITNNWLESQKRLGLIYNTTLICEDEETYKYFRPLALSQKFNVLYTRNYSMGGALNFNMPHYQQLIRRRTVYVRDTLYAGYDVLLVDVDTVWVRDPLSIIRDTYDNYDMWVAPGYDPEVPCPCFMYMKSIAPIKTLTSRWVNRLRYKPRNRRETDQNALQYVMKKYSSNFRLMTLDKMQFPTGKDFFNPDWYVKNIKNVIVIHGNHLGREDNKTATFKRFGLWFV